MQATNDRQSTDERNRCSFQEIVIMDYEDDSLPWERAAIISKGKTQTVHEGVWDIRFEKEQSHHA